MKKLLIIFMLLAVCLTFAGCTKAPTEGTNAVSSSDTSSSVTHEEADYMPPLSIPFEGERLKQLRSIDLNDKENICGLLSAEGFDDDGDPCRYLDPLIYSEEYIRKIADFLRMLKIPEIKGADVCGIYICTWVAVSDAYMERIEIKYRFRDPIKPGVFRIIELDYSYADGAATFEQLLENSIWVENDEVITCKNGIKVAGMTERTAPQNLFMRCFAEWEGCPVRLTYAFRREDITIDFSGVPYPTKAELLDILESATFTSIFATDASDQTAD